MLPPEIAELLTALGHDAKTPAQLGAHNLDDEVLIQIASVDNRVVVTENASDFAAVITCPVLLVRKAWWPSSSLSAKLAAAIDGWGRVNPEPGPWPHWLSTELR